MPWFTMPTGHDARRRAAAAEVEAALAAMKCAMRLLQGCAGVRQCELVAVMAAELARAEAALRKLHPPLPPSH